MFQQRLDNILDSQWLTNNGPIVQQFESSLSEYLNVKHCIAVSNGTVAIELVVKALGLGGEVVIPSFTFIATAHALQWHGVKPVFCDIDPETFCIDPAKVESLVTPETSAIMGVHVYGRVCDVEALNRIASANDIPLIFDAAHAVGCTHGGQRIGSLGTCEIFSFHATKVLNSIEGGAITTNDDELAERLRRLRNFGFPGDGRDVTTELGTNAKMNEFCAAMGLTNLGSLADFIAVNKTNYAAYCEGLAEISGIRVFEFDPNEKNNHQYVIALVDHHEFGHRRDTLMQALHGEGILARRYFSPGCHAMEPYASRFPHAAQSLPVTVSVSKQVIALPTGTQLGPHEIQKICEYIRDFQAAS
jgi:dTDP-4-amino-4,6-dideoxygalactose transaminase